MPLPLEVRIIVPRLLPVPAAGHFRKRTQSLNLLNHGSGIVAFVRDDLVSVLPR